MDVSCLSRLEVQLSWRTASPMPWGVWVSGEGFESVQPHHCMRRFGGHLSLRLGVLRCIALQISLVTSASTRRLFKTLHSKCFGGTKMQTLKSLLKDAFRFCVPPTACPLISAAAHIERVVFWGYVYGIFGEFF